MFHLGKGEIEGFLAGRLESAGRRMLILHLLGGCSSCRTRMKEATAPLFEEEPWLKAEPVAEEEYESAIARACASARAFSKRWQKETSKLDRALELLDHAPGGLGDASFPARQAQALHGWPLCEALLRKSQEARFTDLKRMLDLAESAAGVAEHIRPAKYPWPGFLADLRARAFAELGNAYRLNLRFHDAEESFARARAFLEEGTGDPSLNAQVLDLEASFRTGQRRLNEAISLLNQVHDLYLEIGDLHLAGRALISKGIYTRCNGDPQEAVYLLERGLDLLDRERDPRLVGIGKYALVDAFADCGKYREASRLLFRSGLRETFVAEPLLQLKVRWVEGKIHAGLGRLAKAERALSEVRQEYLQRGQIYEAALIGLELAAVWLRQGRAAEVRELAEEMHAVFEDLGVQLEAAKALRFIQEACRRQAVTVSMIERVRTFLERLPWQPGLRFEPAMFAP